MLSTYQLPDRAVAARRILAAELRAAREAHLRREIQRKLSRGLPLSAAEIGLLVDEPSLLDDVARSSQARLRA